MNKRVTLDMPEEMHQLIVEYASEAGAKPDDYLREMIQRHLEDLQDIAAAEAATESIRNGEPTFTLAEVKQRLGLDD